ncbi:YhzD family protein [Peribacillus sp. SCS-155]|uniref:YhzD family protein n=1 Tax=Peribacillus sedimenti TaxID=3115297 RepID=UPI0039058D7C
MSRVYKLTVFEPSGEKLLDESFEADNDEQAKEQGSLLLQEKNFEEHTHRCTSPAGKLILFHR